MTRHASRREVVPRSLAALALYALAAARCLTAQQAPDEGRPAYSLISSSVGAADARGEGSVFGALQFTRVAPRTPGFDIGLELHDFNGIYATGIALNIGVSYALTASKSVDIVPGVGLTTVGVSDSDGGGAGAGVYGSAHVVWRLSPHLALRGGAMLRAFLTGGGVSPMVSGVLGVGFTP
jgi:hypothetical protein